MNSMTDLWGKECGTCNKTLPRSAYYTHTRNKYAHCKSCENKRLAKYRADKKRADSQLVGEKLCEACYKIVPMKRIADTGICKGRVCKACHIIQLHHKDPHMAVINKDGKCERCSTYGKSDNCIISSQSYIN